LRESRSRQRRRNSHASGNRSQLEFAVPVGLAVPDVAEHQTARHPEVDQQVRGLVEPQPELFALPADGFDASAREFPPHRAGVDAVEYNPVVAGEDVADVAAF